MYSSTLIVAVEPHRVAFGSTYFLGSDFHKKLRKFGMPTLLKRQVPFKVRDDLAGLGFSDEGVLVFYWFCSKDVDVLYRLLSLDDDAAVHMKSELNDASFDYYDVGRLFRWLFPGLPSYVLSFVLETLFGLEATRRWLRADHDAIGADKVLGYILDLPNLEEYVVVA